MRQTGAKAKTTNNKSASLRKKTKGSAKTAANQKALKQTYETRSNASCRKLREVESCFSDPKRKRSIKFIKKITKTQIEYELSVGPTTRSNRVKPSKESRSRDKVASRASEKSKSAKAAKVSNKSKSATANRKTRSSTKDKQEKSPSKAISKKSKSIDSEKPELTKVSDYHQLTTGSMSPHESSATFSFIKLIHLLQLFIWHLSKCFC
jgi:hypothetical protein